MTNDKEYMRAYRLAHKEKFKEYFRRRYAANKEKYKSRSRARYKANTQQIAVQTKKYYLANAERIKARNRLRYARNKDKISAQQSAWKRANREKVNAFVRRKFRSDLNALILHRLRTRISQAFRNQATKKAKKTTELLGCSVSSFRIYIESKFEPGMSWENYGKGWHLDHIVPCALFDLSKPEHQKRCFHFSNYQPLFAVDNCRKRDRLFRDPECLDL